MYSFTSYLQHILTARVYDVAIESPLDWAPHLSRKTQSKVYLKREDLQPVFSFKLRGAYNKMVRLSLEQKMRGVIAASAGNHAQGVALAAKQLNVKAVIVMPRTTPTIKVNGVRHWGAEVVLHGDTYDEAFMHAQQRCDAEGLTFIHPYDDVDVIAGQGTIGVEMLRQHAGDIRAIFVPVGGGGLIAGVGAYVKSIRPDIQIIAVEPEDAPTLHDALQAHERVVLQQVGLFADGVAVKQIGEETFRLARQCVDASILVSTDEICAAIQDIYEDTRAIAEPSGAVALAGLKKYVTQQGAVQDASLIAIVSGANMNFHRLRHVSERAELGERREALIAVTIPERKGSFLEFCQAIEHRSMTEFNYRYANADEAHVFAGVQLEQGDNERFALIHRLESKGYRVVDLTHNEMAKLHIRYMVGGRGLLTHDELVYRFEFPERPGALQKFLLSMGHRWNISMFHYRNHGAANGRVLVGIQVPHEERAAFQTFLNELDYPYVDETHNAAYDLFLK